MKRRPDLEQVDWPSLSTITVDQVEQEPFPVEAMGALRAVTDAVCRQTGMGATLVAPVVLGAASGAIGNIYKTQTADRTLSALRPVTVNTLTLADSGFRKSTIFDTLFAGHRDADNTLIDRWNEAVRKSEAAENNKKKEKPPAPAEEAPHWMRGDATVESFYPVITQRRNMGSVTDEAVVQAKGWSGASDQVAKTMGEFNGFMQGTPMTRDRARQGERGVRVHGHVLFCWMIQPDYGEQFIFLKESKNGFAGRVLVSKYEGMSPRSVEMEDHEIIMASKATKDFRDWVRSVREYADLDCEYQRIAIYTPNYGEVHLTEEARKLLNKWVDEYADQADVDTEEGMTYTPGFLRRAPELICRVAATVLVYHRLDVQKLYDTEKERRELRAKPKENPRPLAPPNTRMKSEDIKLVKPIIDWYYRELKRLEESHTTSDIVTLVQDTLRAILGPITKDNEDGDWFSNRDFSQKCPTRLRKDLETRKRVLDILEETHHIKGDISGKYWQVNPELLNV